MYVQLGYRRQGVAKAVLRYLIDQAECLGYDRLLLQTGNKQLPAMRLYESFGFARIPAFGEYVNDPTSVCYERHPGSASD